MLLAAAGSRRTKDAGQFAVKRAGGPQPARLVKESAHLAGHIAKAGRGTKDNGVVLGQLLRCGDWRILCFPAGFQKQFCGHGFGYTLDNHLCA